MSGHGGDSKASEFALSTNRRLRELIRRDAIGIELHFKMFSLAAISRIDCGRTRGDAEASGKPSRSAA